jgi:hypothetical protein
LVERVQQSDGYYVAVSRLSDSVISFWSTQASAAMFYLVRSSDGISSRGKKRLESMSWITFYNMMVEIIKDEEKLMQLEMVADGGNGMMV